MKIFSASDFRLWDAATIRNEPIASIDLMERAANRCVEWIDSKNFGDKIIRVFCGKGNNGGDGLAIARMLAEKGKSVSVYIVSTSTRASEDFETNLKRLEGRVSIHYINDITSFPPLLSTDIVIDAIFGTGLNKAPEAEAEAVIQKINQTASTIIAVDLPSGLFADSSSDGNAVIHASYTLTFQSLKLAMLLSESGKYCGEITVLDIGLDQSFYNDHKALYQLTSQRFISQLLRPRNRFSHKGNFGHALLVAGSYGKMGAAVLGANACIRSGCGLLTAHIPECGYEIMQTAVPEAMCEIDGEKKFIADPPSSDKYDAIGIGPGIGTNKETVGMLKKLLKKTNKPVVIDADAINCLAVDKSILELIPAGSILTPHPKEFDRLCGEHKNEFDRMQSAIAFARKQNLTMVLKGHHTMIADANDVYFNNTGNSGMAKAGSGDVLTGILTSLLAQQYHSIHAANLGCWLHGLAGDLAAAALGEESMTAADIVKFLPPAFRILKEKD